MNTGTPTPLLRVQHLRKSYGDFLAVKDVGFEVAAGEILGLLGPNGAGKSTTMMMIAGLLTPDQGEVLIDGHAFDASQPSHRRDLGVVPQELAIYPELTARENLRFFGKLYGLRGKILEDRCTNLLARLGLTDAADRQSRDYSGGMKRRLNFGIALMHEPRLLILDEPTVGVDPQSRAHLLDCVRDVALEGVGVIYASHYMEEVQTLCSRVAIVDHGQVLAYDSIDRLLSGLSADVHLTIGGEINGQLGDLGRVITTPEGKPEVVIDGERPDRTAVLQEVLQRLSRSGIAVERIETQQSNLERLFLKLTGNKLRD